VHHGLETLADPATVAKAGAALTDRELTILRMLPAPGSLRELAADLFVTLNTLKTHLRAIYRKLGAESREEAVIRAREGGLI
jgi:LuxR family transcriptional regulator, maltose regulon positive regulatory protein